MKMIDMKMDAQETKDYMPEVMDMPASEVKPSGPKYPYDLQICIEDDNVEALGLADTGYGDKVTITCECEVIDAVDGEDENGPKTKRRLQIQKIGNGSQKDDAGMFISRK